MRDENCLFCRMIEGKIPIDKVDENEHCLAFRDIQAQAPCHILIIPKTHYSGVSEMSDPSEIGELILMANRVAKKEALESGYRLVFNQGLDAGQSVFHTHLHLLGKRKMNWPPG